MSGSVLNYCWNHLILFTSVYVCSLTGSMGWVVVQLLCNPWPEKMVIKQSQWVSLTSMQLCCISGSTVAVMHLSGLYSVFPIQSVQYEVRALHSSRLQGSDFTPTSPDVVRSWRRQWPLFWTLEPYELLLTTHVGNTELDNGPTEIS